METLMLVLLTVPITLLTIFFTFSSLSKKRLPPQAGGGWPLIGHLSLLSGPELFHITLANMADKYGPIFCIRLGVLRAVVVSSSEIVRECFTSTNDVRFSHRPTTAALQHMGYDFAMFAFNPSDRYWRELRKISTQKLLSHKKVSMSWNSHEIEVRAMIRSLYKSCVADVNYEKGRVPLDMVNWFGDLTLNLIVRMVVGESLKKEMDMGNDGKRWHESTRAFLRSMGDLTLSDAIPFLKLIDYSGGKIKKFKEIGREMDTMLESWLDFQKKKKKKNDVDLEEEDEEESFMGQLLDASQSVAEEFPRYDADTINKATCQTMILGGTGTITSTLTWALSLLLNNRCALQTAQHELDKIVGRERRVRQPDLEKLAYLKAVIKETLRLYPQTAVAPARVTWEDCILAGYHVPAGTWLMVNVWKIQRDPRVWKNADEFIPERFLADAKEIDFRSRDYELLPFGGGKRVCPGIALSLQVMELALASLLHGFDIETENGEAVEMSASVGSTLVKATPLNVLLKPRLSPHLYL